MRSSRSLLVGALLVASAAVTESCLLDSSGRGSPDAVGGGGNGGGGRSTATTSNAGGTGAGGSTPVDCEQDAECPDLEASRPCLESRCVDGKCAVSSAADGAPCGPPAGECYGPLTCQGGECVTVLLPLGAPLADADPGDCKAPVCDGRGNPTTLPADDQQPPRTECAIKTCGGGEVMVAPQNEGEDCLLGNLKCCDGHCCDPITCLGCID